MRKTIKVAKWEIKKNLKNKTFLISILLTPLIMLIFGGLPTLLQDMDSGSVQNIYLVDQIGLGGIEDELDGSGYKVSEYSGDIEALKDKVVEEGDSSYIVLDQDSLSSGSFTVNHGDDVSIDTSQIQAAINRAIQGSRLEELGIDRDKTDYVTESFSVGQRYLLEEETDTMSKVVPAVFAGLILFSVFMSGMMTFQSATQEKRDKMTEVLLSSVEPRDIMQGKIIGYFLLGLIQVSVWGAVAGIVATYRFEIPVLDYLLVKEFPLMLLYALLGYLLFSSLFVSLGATINDIYSAGNFQSVIMLLPMLPIFFVGPVTSNPHGIVAKVGSYFPFSTSGVMLIRFVTASKVPAVEIVITLVILLVSIVIAMKVAGKVFKTALLMYGKNATPTEIIKWIRQ